MSAPGGSAPPPRIVKDVDRRRSLGKYVKRMSSVFKRDRSGKSSASSTPAAPATPAPRADDRESAPAAPAAAPSPAPAAAPATAAAAATTTTTATPAPVTQELNRSALQQERARALFAKYGLTLESHEWISASTEPISVQRVERPIRMRVHRTCHHCGTTYGAHKVCAKCDHKRCKKCPRYPKKKAPADKGKQREPADTPKKKKTRLLTVTTRSGDERVYQPIKQRVRRTCHKCDALFIPPTATACEQCRHIRCSKCPREPAKLTKWPKGYPGDVEPDSETEVERERELETARRIWRKTRQRVRWECEECHRHFIDGSPQCPGCGHERCDKCTRLPLKKSKKEREFDPDVIRAVEEKLRALAVDDEPPTSSAEAA